MMTKKVAKKGMIPAGYANGGQVKGATMPLTTRISTTPRAMAAPRPAPATRGAPATRSMPATRDMPATRAMPATRSMPATGAMPESPNGGMLKMANGGHAKKEMAALKKGGASKKIMMSEAKEYGMKMANGGKAKMANGGKAFKPCAGCPMPKKCAAAGKCLKGGK